MHDTHVQYIVLFLDCTHTPTVVLMCIINRAFITHCTHSFYTALYTLHIITTYFGVVK